ncbi:MAG TPA: hypothetical protein VNL14_01370 [Candidatus Acidoferrales bacterium]|nr:hypothetical protein [Candidatus Acidoferrales bacterium]
MNRVERLLRGFALAASLALAGGCHEIGHLGDGGADVYRDRQQAEIVGEVRSVDTRLREIEINTDDRRTRVVRYDGQTRVVYRERDYSVANLEPGDYVALRVRTDSSGYPYADLVRVRESVQERRGTIGSRPRVERVQGTVEYVDSRRGEFELRDEYGRRVLVTLRFDARKADIERLRELRRGDYVRVEGRFLNPDRFELEAFV